MTATWAGPFELRKNLRTEPEEEALARCLGGHPTRESGYNTPVLETPLVREIPTRAKVRCPTRWEPNTQRGGSQKPSEVGVKYPTGWEST